MDISTEKYYEEFEKISDYYKADHEESFILKSGSNDFGVMISTPHSREQFRNGKIKSSEQATGVLAEIAHNVFDIPIITKTANKNDDANFDEVSPYRDELVKYINKNEIKLLLDLHQLASFRWQEICLGVCGGENANPQLIDYVKGVFESKGFVVTLDDPFSASKDHNVSHSTHIRCNINAIQIELNSKFFIEEKLKSRNYEIFECLSEIIKNAKNYF